MGLFRSKQKQFNKEADAVNELTGRLIGIINVGVENVELPRFERPDSRFRLNVFCACAVMVSYAHRIKQENHDQIFTFLVQNVTDYCLDDTTKYFGGKIHPGEAQNRAASLAKHYIERLIQMAERVGTTGDPALALNSICEIVHETESPDPIKSEDYERLSPFAGIIMDAMQTVRERRK